jgi:hypothetical protein
VSADPLPDPDTFLSGESGEVSGRRLGVTRTLGDLALDALDRVLLTGPRVDRLAARVPRRRVLALCLYRPGNTEARAIARALRESRHDVRFAFGSMGEPDPALGTETVATGLGAGKFENLNTLLERAGAQTDWALIVDDDVRLPRRFLDRLVGLSERFGLTLAQPAQTLRSHAAWRVTRRRPASLLRETRFVEIGPVTLLSADALAALAPFPQLRFGWGLDLAWSAVAAERGWRLGVADTVAVRHERRPVGSAYPAEAAMAEAREFLAGRPYLPRSAAAETLRTHRRA